MALDDDAEDVGGIGGIGGIGPPLPPDDRLWRHPSELRQHGLGGGPVVPPPVAMSHRPRTSTVALVAGLAGAVLSTAVIAVTGMLSPRVIEREVVEQVAVTPVVSSPMVHGWLGVEGADLTAEQAKAVGADGGALVRQVVAGSPASAAGLSADDVITEVDGRRISSISALVLQLRRHHQGEEVAIGYWRAGRHAEVTVILAARP